MKLISVLWLWGCLLISLSLLYKQGINTNAVLDMLAGGAMTITILCTLVYVKEKK